MSKLACCGKIVGLLGVVVCIIAVIGRYKGAATIFHHEASSLFLAGVGLMVFAILAKTCLCDKKCPTNDKS